MFCWGTGCISPCALTSGYVLGEFRRLYLPLLNRRRKWLSSERNLQVGDLVLVNDNSQLRRHCWPLARVVRVLPDHYDLVHSVVIRWGFPVAREYELDIRKLCLLEASC